MDMARMASRMIARSGWNLVGSPPDVPVVVMIGAPHTSNWDLVIMLLMTRARGVEPRFLMKKEAFRGPAGPLMRKLGGVAVDRSTASGLVEDMVGRASSGEHFHLVIAPEGTRKSGKYWKSGFYRIASQAQIPIVLGFVDGPTKTMGFGPAFIPSGDVRADMDLIREFYADKHGYHPGKRTEPRLREEDEEPGGDPTDGSPPASS
jgi:1-acyl-sn-glycerol-3-phosphate acyltransferase